MNEFKLTNKVVQSNDLIASLNKLDRTTFKLFEMAVSCIDTSNPKQEVELSKKDIFLFFNMKNENKYTRMEAIMKRLSQQGIVLDLANDEKILINVTSTLRWGVKDNNDAVIIKFNDSIMPFLVDLKSNFTQYQITEIKSLKSKYSLIMFKWLLMKFNQHQYNPIIDMDELRELTNTVDEYSDFRHFDRRVLQKATSEITEHTGLVITYEKISKIGRKVTSIKFNISKKKPLKAIDITVHQTNDAESNVEALCSLFAMELGKDLDFAEKTLIRALESRYGAEKMIDALKTMIIKRTTSLSYLEKMLRNGD